MRYLVFIVVYPILWCISMLPFRILYILSDFVFLIVYYIIGYRKKLVKSNIALAMPYLTEKERIITERKFYKHLCDIFLEMAKTMTISKTEMNKRYTFTNLEVYKQLESEQKSIAVMIAHYASYEWVISLNNQMNYKGYAIYKPTKSVRTRSPCTRWGGWALPPISRVPWCFWHRTTRRS